LKQNFTENRRHLYVGILFQFKFKYIYFRSATATVDWCYIRAWWSNRRSSKKLSRTPPHDVYHQNNIDFLLSRNCIESGELTANYQKSLGSDSTRRVTGLGTGCLSHHMF